MLAWNNSPALSVSKLDLQSLELTGGKKTDHVLWPPC